MENQKRLSVSEEREMMKKRCRELSSQLGTMVCYVDNIKEENNGELS